MTKIYVPSKGVTSWQELLAEPVKHWRIGYSARTLAYDWEEADGLPPEVAAALHSHFGVKPELAAAFPEHKVDIPGPGFKSQSDLFALVRLGADLAGVAVEGKVAESFDKTLGEWAPLSTVGRRQRFEGITGLLGLSFYQDPLLRYQLFHRAASAVIEARRFCCRHAIMLVQSYSQSNLWFEDYARFAALFKIAAEKGRIGTATLPGGMPLHLGWIVGDPAMLSK